MDKSTSRKRLFDEIDTLDSLSSPMKSAKIHGIVTTLSPMKSGPKMSYFEGKLADDKASIRLVGFNKAQHHELEAHCKEGDMVTFENCQIQKSKYNDNMEVLLKQSSKVLSSPKKLLNDVLTTPSTSSHHITLDQLSSIPDYDLVDVKVKVTELGEKLEVTSNLYKQDVMISDSTDTSKLTLWQESINSLQLAESYQIENLVVKSYNDVKFLSPSKYGYAALQLDDIGTVNEEPMKTITTELKNAEIAAVGKITKSITCLSCNGRVDTINEKIGCCTKCSMTLKLDKCKQKITIELFVTSDNETCTLYANLAAVHSITENDTFSELSDLNELTASLLMSDPFTLIYDSTRAINSVNRS
ncbi:hypothetical protein SPONN_1545 [uncultured Candidatus Thioglobus sp.]|nr:hypothetical protein SPONN_1545 [uncultured Candidatus Thioglobus sp.]